MEAKELMIGNYVKSSNIVFCIERITTKEVFMYSHGHGIRAADSCKKIQPIPITDIRELIKLADEHKSVAYQAGLTRTWFVKPAAVVANWSLRMLSLRTFYKIEKI